MMSSHRPVCGTVAVWACLAALGSAQNNIADGAAAKPIVTVDHFIAHYSTVPAIQDKLVPLYLREKVQGRIRGGSPAVLMIHGHPVGSSGAFDVAFGDYSWMDALAAEGFDVFAIDLTGYGLSPTPAMQDPCNASAMDQGTLLSKVTSPCAPRYAFQLTTIDSDWADIDAAVDYIRQKRGIPKVSLIGWSAGGPRAGGYAARHADKVDRLILYSPVYNRSEGNTPPPSVPAEGVPLSVRSVASFNANWDTQIGCQNQFDPAIRDVITSGVVRSDSVAHLWGEGLYRAPVLNPRWGWNATSAADIQAPTLIIRGALDTQIPEATSRELYADLTAPNKVLARIACASHFMLWEMQHGLLYRFSAEWLRSGTFGGSRRGVFSVDMQGTVKPE